MDALGFIILLLQKDKMYSSSNFYFQVDLIAIALHSMLVRVDKNLLLLFTAIIPYRLNTLTSL
jgi:hypothetical protein